MSKKIILLLCLACLSKLQAQNDCRYSEALEQFTQILPQEKVYVHSDRPFYEPGETIWFKVYLSDAGLLASQKSSILRAELIDPRGNPVKKMQLQATDGSTHGDFELSKEAAGGIYKLRVYTVWQQNFEESLIFEKALTVQKSLLPNILMQLDFLRESYGPGSQVIAKFKLRSKDNYALANHPIEYVLMLEGKKLFSRSMKTNAAGHADIEFELPKILHTADALLNVMVSYDGKLESISRSVPINTQNIDLQFLPEGGNLVGNTQNVVAFKALNEFGKPADIEADIFDESGKEIAKIRSYHQGMGSFFLRPEVGSRYTAKITEPKGIDKLYELPIATQNMALRMESHSPSELVFNIHSPSAEPLCVVLQMQDKVQLEIGLEAVVGNNQLRIPTHSLPLGIAQITVFDAKERPYCERLVFVNKHRNIKLQVHTHKPSYQIRDSILLDIQMTDETGKGLQGDFSLAVVDDKLWTFADDKQAHILSQLLLCADLRGEVFEPNFYFAPEEPKADTALDYLMLTQGWRRYDWKNILQQDSAQLAMRIKLAAEPNRIIEGTLKIGDSPLAKHKIKLEAGCAVEPAFVLTDEKGYFNIPHIKADCPIRLKTTYRGFEQLSEPIDFHLKSKELLNASHKKQTTVFFYNAVNNSNTIFSNASRYYNSQEKYFEYAATDMVFYPSGNANSGDLRGTVFDENKEPLSFANLTLYQGGTNLLIKNTYTDFDGLYNFYNIPSGEYDLVISYIGYPSKKIIGLRLGYEQSLRYDIYYEVEEMLAVAENMNVVLVQSSHVPLIELSSSGSRGILGSADIQRMATRSISSIATTTAGVSQRDEGERIVSNGSRASSDLLFIDGVRVIGGLNLTTVSSSVNYGNLNTNSPMVEMQRRMGNNYNSNTLGRNSIVTEQIEAVVSPQIELKVVPKGQDALYYGKIYYAPDYSEYHRKKSKPYKSIPIRKDFRNTVYWQPYVSTDSMGKAKILYFHSDATGTFRILMEGVGKGGKLGRAEQTYTVQMPFELEVKMPKFLCSGDTLDLPLLLRNQTADTILGNFAITMPLLITCLSSSVGKLTIPPYQTLKHNIRYVVGHGKADAVVKLDFRADGFTELLEYPLIVNPKGFPMHANVADNKVHFKGRLQVSDTLPNSLKARLEIHTSNIESLLSALAGMIREPHGCFEQVSSSNYPNILALEMMEATNSLQAGVYDRAQAYLNTGYRKLAGYESAGGGFEWFGGPVGHEGLTAFGLMEFHDMSRVYKGVNAAMTARAKNWLLSRRNGQGGWLNSSGYSHGWGKSQAVADAYIVHALAYIGERGIEKELAAVSEEAMKSKDLYRLGLATLANFYQGNSSLAEKMSEMLFIEMETMGMDKLRADYSITYSSGNALKAEILGLAILAGLQNKKSNMAQLHKFSSELLKLRSGGYFGNTQATVWALKALCALAITHQKEATESGVLLVKINGKLAFTEKLSSNALHNIVADKLAQHLVVGENLIEIDFEGIQNPPPYSFDVDWQTFTPPSAEHCSIQLQTQLSTSKANIGETVRLSATLTNLDTKSAPTPIAIIGIPSGLSVQPWQLKELQEKGLFHFYELQDNYLVLYYRGMDAGEIKNIHLDLKAEVPGAFQAAASCTYLYYNNTDKYWTAGELVNIE